MFEIFELQIQKLMPIYDNIEFINENYDLIQRSIDRMEIVLTDYYFQSFTEAEDFFNDVLSNSITIALKEANKDLGFI